MVSKVIALPQCHSMLKYTCWLSLTSLCHLTFLTTHLGFHLGTGTLSPCSSHSVVLYLSLVTLEPPVALPLIHGLI